MEFENSSGNAEKRKRISVGWNGKLYLQRFASMLEELDKNLCMQMFLKRSDEPNAVEIPPRIHCFWKHCEKPWMQLEVNKLSGPNLPSESKQGQR